MTVWTLVCLIDTTYLPPSEELKQAKLVASLALDPSAFAGECPLDYEMVSCGEISQCALALVPNNFALLCTAL